MNQYVTGVVIKGLREKNKMTQLQLAEKLGVSDKSVSKWETSRGLPDITLLKQGLRSGESEEYSFTATVMACSQSIR